MSNNQLLNSLSNDGTLCAYFDKRKSFPNLIMEQYGNPPSRALKYSVKFREALPCYPSMRNVHQPQTGGHRVLAGKLVFEGVKVYRTEG